MNALVVDSSVAYKWISHIGEDHVEEAFVLLRDHRSGTHVLAAPATLYVELANAVRNSRNVDRETALDIVAGLETLQIELVTPTPERLVAALRLSYRHNLSIYDALFLALAEELSCPLVTADRKAFVGIDSPVEVRLL